MKGLLTFIVHKQNVYEIDINEAKVGDLIDGGDVWYVIIHVDRCKSFDFDVYDRNKDVVINSYNSFWYDEFYRKLQ